MPKHKRYEDYVDAKMLETIKMLKKKGHTDVFIYDHINISTSIAARWKRKYDEFRKAFVEGNKDLHDKLEETLYTRAMGMYVEDVDTVKELRFDEETESMQMQVVKSTTKKRFIYSDQCLVRALFRLNPEAWVDNYKAREAQMKVAEENLEIAKERLATSTADKIEEWIESLPDEKIEKIISRIRKKSSGED